MKQVSAWRRYCLASTACLWLATASCNRSTDPFPSSRADQIVAEDAGVAGELNAGFGDVRSLELCFSEGNGLRGFDSIVCRGRICTFIWIVPPRQGDTELKPKRADFEITQADLDALIELLAESGIADLDKSYTASNVWDGTIVYVSLIVNDVYKTVLCSNSFPQPVLSLRRHLREQVIAPRLDELEQTAKLIPSN